MSDKYSGLLGMLEMEEAVKIMDEYAESNGGNIAEFSYSVRQFLPPRDARKFENGGDSSEIYSIVGLCQLLARGWMEPDYPNNMFIPSKDLIKKLNERWGTNYPEPRHSWERPPIPFSFEE